MYAYLIDCWRPKFIFSLPDYHVYSYTNWFTECTHEMLKYYIVEVLLGQWLNVHILFISLWICDATYLAAKYLLCPVIIICSSNAKSVLLQILSFFGTWVCEYMEQSLIWNSHLYILCVPLPSPLTKLWNIYRNNTKSTSTENNKLPLRSSIGVKPVNQLHYNINPEN